MSKASTGKANGQGHCLAAVAFGSHLREWRDHNNVSLKELAADLEISVSTVSAWETGRRFPSGVHCDLVATHLGQAVYELFNDQNGSTPATD